MADSDEEGDSRKSRDKFKRERSDYGDRYRRDTSSRDDSSRRRSRDYRGDSGRNEFSPPQKRMRRDNNWEGYGGGYEQMPRMPWGPREQPPPAPPSGSTVMTFKQFLAQQDDSIEDTEAVQKYNEYKKDVRKKQLQLFFDKHKDEECIAQHNPSLQPCPLIRREREAYYKRFRNKYHPVSKSQLKAQQIEGYKARHAAYSILRDHGLIKDVVLCSTMSKQITKLMDSAVILMEGGTVYDLQVLDEGKKEETKSDGIGEDDSKSEEGDKKLQKYDLEVAAGAEEKTNDADEGDSDVDKTKKKSDGDVDDDDTGVTADPDPSDDTEKNEEEEEDKATDTASPASPEAPRALHLTKSAYIRHIAPNVSSTDILEVCKQFTGYLRMALDGPDFEKNYELRGWVTFAADSNIREVISQLCSIKNSQLTCMANRDLTRRVKHLSHDVFPYSKEVVRADIELATTLIQYLDSKHELFTEDNPLLKETEVALASISSTSNGSTSKQRSKEDEEDDDDEEEEEGGVHDDSDEWSEEGDNLLKINDNLLWYLRIVHSVDYYGGNMVNQEHQMPHRCGIITARPAKPDVIAVQPEEVLTYMESANKKIMLLMEETKLISDDEASELGKKDVDSEIEKFIADNTKEISKEKFLCPLSGKKFRGPEFVRKHIFNKHASKLEEVKQNVEFFHNYLYDPGRPMPLESELLTEEPAESGFHSQHPPDFVPWGTPHMMMFRRGMFPQRGFDMFPFRGGGRMRRRGGSYGSRGRRMIEYHDLDAPADMEF